MGREAVGTADWRGETAEVRALLESQEIILRGGIRARLPRSGITAVTSEGGRLRLLSGGEPLVLTLGEVEADRWVTALLKPPPSLAAKLGISDAKRAFVIGVADDEALSAALDGASTDALGDAAILVAVLRDEADLEASFGVAESVPQLPVWFVSPKGGTGPVGAGEVRAYLRERGYVDSKSSAVSDRLTATRYARRKTA